MKTSEEEYYKILYEYAVNCKIPVIADINRIHLSTNWVYFPTFITEEELKDDQNFVARNSWYVKLLEDDDKDYKILAINRLDLLKEEEQLKIANLIHNRKIGKYRIPNNTFILMIIDMKNIDKVSPFIKSISKILE